MEEKKIWTVGSSTGNAPQTIKLTRVFGTTSQVDAHLAALIRTVAKKYAEEERRLVNMDEHTVRGDGLIFYKETYIYGESPQDKSSSRDNPPEELEIGPRNDYFDIMCFAYPEGLVTELEVKPAPKVAESDQTDIYHGQDIFIAYDDVVLMIAEGSGDNLDAEDIEKGYVDYFNLEVYDRDEFDFEQLGQIDTIGGGFMLKKAPIKLNYYGLPVFMVIDSIFHDNGKTDEFDLYTTKTPDYVFVTEDDWDPTPNESLADAWLRVHGKE